MDDSGPPGPDREAMLYDWFKHLTSMSLLALGGVLSLSQLSAAADIKRSTLILVLVLLGVAGVMAFSAADQIVHARTKGEPLPRQVLWMQRATPAVLGMGLGAFLYVFVKAVG
ncbi:hypothetical protein [Sphingomonas sp.]|uniref:hypothetical protein n=1 Tax=Sphingomonas sp. TaxID=28214 RepID=UPI00286EA07B|nr:hypothetical protein [Sphingomonas sp.]